MEQLSCSKFNIVCEGGSIEAASLTNISLCVLTDSSQDIGK